MAMALRLSEEETESLRELATNEGGSMQEVARIAIANHIRAARGGQERRAWRRALRRGPPTVG